MSQRTYVLPRVVNAIGFTESERGISNKNLLIAVAPGQVFSADMRLLNPRRPMAEPSEPEKEEVGLIFFVVFLIKKC